MIEIIIAPSKKIPCLASLYVPTAGLSKRACMFLSNIECVHLNKKSGKIEVPLTKIPIISHLLTKYDDVKFINKLPTSKKIEEKSIGKYKFRVKPYKHQLRAVEYGLNHDGWLLLDDMGLGKTKAMIDLVSILKHQKEVKHCLVICGIASLRYNWANEIERNSNESYKILGRRINSKGNEVYSPVADRLDELKKGGNELFVITNVETLQDKGFAEAYNKSKYKFDMIIFDEIHTCKNPSSKSAKTLLRLRAKRKIGLTGTIVVSSPEDCYVPLKWTGNTDSTYGAFKIFYNKYGGFRNKEVLGHKNLDYLREILSQCALRRVKENILDLPVKNYLQEYVDMGSAQSKLYCDVRVLVMDELDKLDHKPSIMEEIAINLRLRQITACPSILSTTVKESAKINRCEQMVEKIVSQGDKAVIFSNFKETVYQLEEMLRKYNPVIGTGDISDKEFIENVERFQNNEENKIFIGTWQKCGTGITLTAASYMIFIDTPWTDSDFQQSCDRIYRIGQTKPVFIYTLIAKGTYDERVQEIIDRKENLAENILERREKK